MIKIILYFIGLCLLCASFTLQAEEIKINSIYSTKDVGLTCEKKKIYLRIYSKSFRAKVVVTKKKNILDVSSNTELPIAYRTDTHLDSEEVVFTINKRYFYFIQDKKIVSDKSLDPMDIKDAEDELSAISKALNEAHKKNKCLSWSFE